jgi:hypothetical protein
MADRLLPGITTITTRSRYISMLCAALANAEKYRTFPTGSKGLAQRRRAVEPFERLWALACVAASKAGVEGAAEGLRGVTASEKRYRRYSEKEQPMDLDFNILLYQGRTGAFGTYWTCVVGSELADKDSGALTAEGHELAKQFPAPDLPENEMERLADPDKGAKVIVSVDQLRRWGKRVNLVSASATEKSLLEQALTARDRRNCVHQALAALERTKPLPAVWNAATIGELRKVLAEATKAVELGLPDVLEAVLYFERAHEAVLRLFETVLWQGTEKHNSPVNELVQDPEFKRRADRCIETSKALVGYWEKCPPNLKSLLNDFTVFAYAVRSCRSAKDVLDAVLRRHRDVQEGKLDGGVPKRQWVTVNDGKVELPLARFQLTKKPAAAAGRELTHAYRLEQFVQMLRQVGALRTT